MDPTVDWNTHDATLREMASRGATASEIAAAIPHATRSAVLGRAKRKGVQMTRGRRDSGPAKASTAAPASAAKRPVVVPVACERKRPFQPKAPIKPLVAAAPGGARAFVAPAGTATVPLEALETGLCRWPYDGICEAPTTYCGEVADGPYCAAHAQLAYQPRVGPALSKAALPRAALQRAAGRRRCSAAA